jgi:hypothetical protein
MTEETPKKVGMDIATRIGGAILLIWIVGAIVAHFFGSPSGPVEFSNSTQYTPHQAEMLWRMERAKVLDAQSAGDNRTAEWWERQCERDTGISCSN